MADALGDDEDGEPDGVVELDTIGLVQMINATPFVLVVTSSGIVEEGDQPEIAAEFSDECHPVVMETLVQVAAAAALGFARDERLRERDPPKQRRLDQTIAALEACVAAFNTILAPMDEEATH